MVVPAFVGLGGLFRRWLGSFFALGGLLAFLLVGDGLDALGLLFLYLGVVDDWRQRPVGAEVFDLLGRDGLLLEEGLGDEDHLVLVLKQDLAGLLVGILYDAADRLVDLEGDLGREVALGRGVVAA